MSSTTLAIGTSAGSLLLAAVGGALTTLTLIHHKKVWAWMKAMRNKDDTLAVLATPETRVEALYEEQCGLAQKPCRAEDFAELTRITQMIRGTIDNTPIIRTELNTVVTRAQEYIRTAFPEIGTSTWVTIEEHGRQLQRAMQQEHARVELERAIADVQRKISELRQP
ncbi:hypothetical protein [Streptomyces caniscabiei]|uniref:hypothetical protein n=1 Tax=Streptomyces caniscabiei TaxID=2746961 RepID=UPI00117DD8B1|nr:hypothetical protein [Streptomyces caniscabiei]